MQYFLIIIKLVIGLGVLNVWLIRANRATKWRGGDATNMREEFAVYGLPEWFMYVVGGLKILLSLGLILSIWVPYFEDVSAIGMGVLMIGAVAMHIKVKDKFIKAFPAMSMLGLSALVYYF